MSQGSIPTYQQYGPADGGPIMVPRGNGDKNPYDPYVKVPLQDLPPEEQRKILTQQATQQTLGKTICDHNR